MLIHQHLLHSSSVVYLAPHFMLALRTKMRTPAILKCHCFAYSFEPRAEPQLCEGKAIHKHSASGEISVVLSVTSSWGEEMVLWLYALLSPTTDVISCQNWFLGNLTQGPLIYSHLLASGSLQSLLFLSSSVFLLPKLNKFTHTCKSHRDDCLESCS